MTKLDDKETRSVNIKFPLKKSSRGTFQNNEESVDAIADDLKILILTNHGERLVHRDFGANLRPLLFEQQGDFLNQRIEDAIVVAVEKWMPFITIVDLVVKDSESNPNLNKNEVNIRIKFSVGNTNLTGETAVSIRGVSI